MDQDQDEKKLFTVKDKRRFSMEGESVEPKEPVEPAERPAVTGADAAPLPTHRSAPPQRGPVDLSSFLFSLAAQAAAAMNPANAAENDLEGARQIIDILELLRVKTQGNRTPEETEVLEGLLYELHMAFVARSRVEA